MLNTCLFLIYFTLVATIKPIFQILAIILSYIRIYFDLRSKLKKKQARYRNKTYGVIFWLDNESEYDDIIERLPDFRVEEDLEFEVIYLVDNKRANLLGDVAQSFITEYNKANKIEAATVTTAVALTPELETKVLAKVTALTGSTNVTLTNVIDESIIGGFVLRVGDTQYNASIASQLGKLKREFSNSL